MRCGRDVDAVGAPPGADDGQRDAGGEGRCHHRARAAAGVADEQRGAGRVGLAHAGVEAGGVGALQERPDAVTLGPGGARGPGHVEPGQLVGGHLVGVADHPEQVDGARLRGHPVEPADGEHDVGLAAGGAPAGLGVVDLDPLAEPLEGVGERAGEVPVAPPASHRRGPVRRCRSTSAGWGGRPRPSRPGPGRAARPTPRRSSPSPSRASRSPSRARAGRPRAARR